MVSLIQSQDYGLVCEAHKFFLHLYFYCSSVSIVNPLLQALSSKVTSTTTVNMLSSYMMIVSLRINNEDMSVLSTSILSCTNQLNDTYNDSIMMHMAVSILMNRNDSIRRGSTFVTRPKRDKYQTKIKDITSIIYNIIHSNAQQISKVLIRLFPIVCVYPSIDTYIQSIYNMNNELLKGGRVAVYEYSDSEREVKHDKIVSKDPTANNHPVHPTRGVESQNSKKRVVGSGIKKGKNSRMRYDDGVKRESSNERDVIYLKEFLSEAEDYETNHNNKQKGVVHTDRPSTNNVNNNNNTMNSRNSQSQYINRHYKDIKREEKPMIDRLVGPTLYNDKEDASKTNMNDNENDNEKERIDKYFNSMNHMNNDILDVLSHDMKGHRSTLNNIYTHQSNYNNNDRLYNNDIIVYIENYILYNNVNDLVKIHNYFKNAITAQEGHLPVIGNVLDACMYYANTFDFKGQFDQNVKTVIQILEEYIERMTCVNC